MPRARRLAFFLLTGLLATDAAGTASLLVDGVAVRRVVAAVVGVVFSVAAGVVYATRPPASFQRTNQPTVDGSQQ